MNHTLSCFIPGTPIPQGSKSISRTSHVYEANKRLRPWRDTMQTHLALTNRGNPPMDHPVVVDVTFYLPRPQRPRFPVPAVKPDVDKLQRALGDALETSRVLTNDSRITDWKARARYANDTQPPGVALTIRPITEADI